MLWPWGLVKDNFKLAWCSSQVFMCILWGIPKVILSFTMQNCRFLLLSKLGGLFYWLSFNITQPSFECCKNVILNWVECGSQLLLYYLNCNEWPHFTKIFFSCISEHSSLERLSADFCLWTKWEQHFLNFYLELDPLPHGESLSWRVALWINCHFDNSSERSLCGFVLVFEKYKHLSLGSSVLLTFHCVGVFQWVVFFFLSSNWKILLWETWGNQTVTQLCG